MVLDETEGNEKYLKYYSELFRHWDQNYWYACYIFLVIQGAILVAFTQIFVNITITGRNIVLPIVTIVGIVFSLLWFFVMRRKISYTHGAEKQLREILKKMYQDIENLQVGPAKVRSSLVVHTYLPFSFILMWIILTLVSIKLSLSSL